MTKILVLSSVFSQTPHVSLRHDCSKNQTSFSVLLQQIAVGFPVPEICVTHCVDYSDNFPHERDWEVLGNYLMPSCLPVKMFAFPKCFLLKAVKDWLLSVFCTLQCKTLHSERWKSLHISDTCHFLWPFRNSNVPNYLALVFHALLASLFPGSFFIPTFKIPCK